MRACAHARRVHMCAHVCAKGCVQRGKGNAQVCVCHALSGVEWSGVEWSGVEWSGVVSALELNPKP
jgi:hypothetical protein